MSLAADYPVNFGFFDDFCFWKVDVTGGLPFFSF